MYSVCSSKVKVSSTIMPKYFAHLTDLMWQLGPLEIRYGVDTGCLSNFSRPLAVETELIRCKPIIYLVKGWYEFNFNFIKG